MDELEEKSERELLQDLKEEEKNLFDLRMKKCTSLLDKPHMLALTKQRIARIRTFLRQKACKSSAN
ncbi:MAG: 50S ribosomal protein L29 [Puniceicoccales bacterium]|jgi:large subunit ribosomal protein L29|nr:50S ribosomal protein L29 [Puniceicoccales bacterium]